MPTISPSVTWDGTAGSGFGGVLPTDVVRTTFKPACGLLTPPHQRITSTLDVAVQSLCNGGTEKVIFHFEGTSVEVSSRSTYTTSGYLGATKTKKGVYVATLDVTGFADGAADLYIEVVPLDPTAQRRIMGPYNFYPNNGGTLPNTGVIRYVDSSGQFPIGTISNGPVPDGAIFTGTSTGAIIEVIGDHTVGPLKITVISGTPSPVGEAWSRSAGTATSATFSSSGPNVPNGDDSNTDPATSGSEAAPWATVIGGISRYKAIKVALGDSAGVAANYSGLVIRLKEGSNYDMRLHNGNAVSTGSTSSGYCIIEADPAGDRDKIRPGVSSGNGSVTRTLLRNFRFVLGATGTIIRGSSSADYVWVHNCDIIGLGAANDSSGFISSAFNESYVTSCRSYGRQAGFGSELVFDVEVWDSSGDIFTGSSLVVDFLVRGHRQESGQHVDLFQCESGSIDWENKVVADGRAEASSGQAIFLTSGLAGTAMKDYAFANLALFGFADTDINFPMDHINIWHCTISSGSYISMGTTQMQEALELTSVSGVFTNEANVNGTNSGFTAEVPKNNTYSQPYLYIRLRTGTPVSGEWVRETVGDASGLIVGGPTYVGKKGYNSLLNTTVNELFTSTITRERNLMNSDWRISAVNIQSTGSLSTWHSSGTLYVPSPFNNYQGGDYTPNELMPRAARLIDVPYDIDGNERAATTAIGAWAASSEYAEAVGLPNKYLALRTSQGTFLFKTYPNSQLNP